MDKTQLKNKLIQELEAQVLDLQSSYDVKEKELADTLAEYTRKNQVEIDKDLEKLEAVKLQLEALKKLK